MSTARTHPGLPDGVTPYDLIDVLEKLRSRLGLRDEDIAYLRCAFRLVRAEDFLPGRICAFWERVAGLADRLGVNVRRITRIETRLEGCGLIQRTGATNGRRFGRRAEDGRILSAGGINLAPMIERAGELLTHLRCVVNDTERLKRDRQRANDLIRQIRSLPVSDALAAARTVFPRLRPSEVQDTEKLAAIIDALEAIVTDFPGDIGQTVVTAPSDTSVRPDTNRERKIKTCSAANAIKSREMHITPVQVRDLASAELREAIELYQEADEEDRTPSWRCIVLATRERAMMLGLSGADWDTARDRLGEIRVALCLLIVDRNATRDGRFKVRDTIAAFVGLVRKSSRDQAVLQTLLIELMHFAFGGDAK